MKVNPTLIDLPLPIETPRVILRPPQIGEGKILNDAIIESFDKLHTFMHWTTHKPTIEESEEVVRQAAANWILKRNEEPYLMLFIIDKNTGQLIGIYLALKQDIGLEINLKAMVILQKLSMR